MMSLFGAWLLVAPAFAQELDLPALSPRAEVMQQVGVVDVTVNYASPAKRDRTVWGDVVKYDELWRTGANTATTLETTGDLTIGGKPVPAGKYAIFSIPGKDSWTVILNKNPNQGGTGQYEEAQDQVRIQVKPEAGAERERLTFLFSGTTDAATTLELEWAGVRVPVPITVDTPTMVGKSIDGYVEGAADTLADAARFKAEHGDVDGALKLIDASIAVNESWYNTWLKADLLHTKGDNKNAYKMAQKAQTMGNAAGEGFFWKDRVEKALAEWKKK